VPKVDDKTAEIDNELRAKGYRLTPRRLMVAEVLAGHEGHLTMDEILSKVTERHPSTNKTTVYRTLELLSSLGMVAVTDLGMGRLEYELQSHRHHHLICEKCHNRIEVDDSFLEPLRESLHEQYGFNANLGHFALFGICAGCAEEMRGEK
jgi:Fur family ferric uptake transcriptional regulator